MCLSIFHPWLGCRLHPPEADVVDISVVCSRAPKATSHNISSSFFFLPEDSFILFYFTISSDCGNKKKEPLPKNQTDPQSHTNSGGWLSAYVRWVENFFGYRILPAKFNITAFPLKQKIFFPPSLPFAENRAPTSKSIGIDGEWLCSPISFFFSLARSSHRTIDSKWPDISPYLGPFFPSHSHSLCGWGKEPTKRLVGAPCSG